MTLAAAPNFRDLGGHPTHDGRTVRTGCIFRSEALLEPTEDDAAALIDKNIVLVCDLRSDGERSHAPNNWWMARGIELLDLDVLAGIDDGEGPWSLLRADPGIDGAVAAMDSVYAAMPAAAAGHLLTIVTRIAAGDIPLLIHCTAGKDRTGFISAMILGMLGVDQPAIFENYLASRGRRTQQALQATRTMVRERAGNGITPEAIEAMMGVEDAYLARSFAVIVDRHGGLEGYLAFAGIDSGLVDRLRGRLLV